MGAAGLISFKGETCWKISGHPVSVVDTTGAGDCFTGYLTAGLAAGMKMEEALKHANKAASLAVTRYGASESIPRLSELPE